MFDFSIVFIYTDSPFPSFYFPPNIRQKNDENKPLNPKILIQKCKQQFTPVYKPKDANYFK